MQAGQESPPGAPPAAALGAAQPAQTHNTCLLTTTLLL